MLSWPRARVIKRVSLVGGQSADIRQDSLEEAMDLAKRQEKGGERGGGVVR